MWVCSLMPKPKAQTKAKPAKQIKPKKVAENQFWAMLRKNAGLYARTARAIEKEFGVSISRQAVRERAEANPELLRDILEETVDIAEEGLHDLMRSGVPNVRLRAIELYLKSKGKTRGYYEKNETAHNHNGEVTVNVNFVDAD